MKTRRTLLALVLSVMMVIGLFPVTAMAGTASSVSYLDERGGEQTCASATEVTSSDNAWGEGNTSKWYVVNSNVTIGSAEFPSRVVVSGNVNLILADGCTLTVNGGINVSEGHSLTIYAQSTGNNAGKLDAIVRVTDTNYNAAIGGSNGQNCGTITINGGTVNATSNAKDYNYGAAIGGGSYSGSGGSGGTITINGGTVNATAESEDSYNYGAAIGGGYQGSGGDITINGGTVKATALSINSNYGAAIGGGGGTITITGGTVTAEAESADNGYGAAIGGGGFSTGSGGSGGTITISGGTVTATVSCSVAYAAAIGDGKSGSGATFSTGENGSAVIFASVSHNKPAISDQSNKASWSGVIFENGTGRVYGNPTIT